MAIVCPHCQHSMTAKGAKPGRYKPKCAKCGQAFGVTIFEDREPVSQILPKAEPAATMAPTETAPQAPQRKQPPRPASPTPQVEETIVRTSPAIAETVPPPARATERTMAHVSNAGSSAPADATGVWQSDAGNDATGPPKSFDATAPLNGNDPTRFETPRPKSADPGMRQNIDGYRLLKELGRGAMGKVYLARQLSLDRDVALKTIQGQWADDPAFIARFTREAYAAAQLTHHNVIQIYDLGQDDEVHYFSMEYVRGMSLDQLVAQQGKLDVNMAVGYVLQAARGLQFAHNHGMVHRDVKPANLMLNDQGIVKVADLGLVKTPAAPEDKPLPKEGAKESIKSPQDSRLAAARADQTMLNMAMGTPAFMSPEQSENAAGVDHRADIYSLGCTLYVLLTGRAPFSGSTAMEVITKHRTEPIVRPDVLVKRIPDELSEIVLRMVAKAPEDRYSHLGEVIADLERLLGIQSGLPFSPSEEHADLLEACQTEFNAAPAARLRKMLAIGFTGLCLVSLLILLPISLPLAGATLGLLLMTISTYFVLSGFWEKTYLFSKTRSLVFSSRWTDWLTYLGGGLLVLVLLYVFGWFWYWLAFAGVAVGLAFVFAAVIDRRVRNQRKAALEKMQGLLRTLRLKGLDEAALQQFVAHFSGKRWEEFFEALFGYEAKLKARESLSSTEAGKKRQKFRAWRDPIVRWIDDKLVAKRDARDRKLLQKVEEKSLEAQGVDLLSARRQAQRVAEALIDNAADARANPQQNQAPEAMSPARVAELKRLKVKAMLAEARAGKYEAKRARQFRTAASPITFLFGPKVRFLLGCLLLAGCSLWARQNQIFSGDELKDVTEAVVSTVKSGDSESLKRAAETTASGDYETLRLPLVGPFVSSFSAGLAGVMLIVFGMFRGWKMSLFALPAAAIMVLGPTLPLPNFGFSVGKDLLSFAAGGILCVLGLLLGRTKAD